MMSKDGFLAGIYWQIGRQREITPGTAGSAREPPADTTKIRCLKAAQSTRR